MKPLSGVAVSVSNAVAWFLIVLGVYVITHGYREPGGGFAGGALVVLCLPLVLSAWGKKRFESWLREAVYGMLELIGLLLFFVLAGKGYPGSPNGGLTPQGSLMSIAVGFIAVGAFSLILIYIYSSIQMMESGAGLGGERGHDRYDR